MERITLNIEGMECSACVARIEQAIGAVDGVEKVRASLLAKTAKVDYDGETATRAAVVRAVREAGYDVVSAPQPRLSSGQIAAVVLIAFFAWLLATAFGIDASGADFPLATSNMSLGMVFIVGVLTSFHCVAMCGGINISQSMPDAAAPATDGKAPRTRITVSAIRPTLLYNAGRVLSYTAIGAVVGAAGSALSLSMQARGAIQLFAAAFMLAMALSMLGVIPGIATLKTRLAKALHLKQGGSKKRAAKGPLVAGLLSGFMPCGPLQAMQLYALGTGSALAGGAAMLCFALGTVPLMLGLGAVAGMASRAFARKAMTAGACVVMAMALFMGSYGWSLAGLPAIAVPNIPQAFADLATPKVAAEGMQVSGVSSSTSSMGCCGGSASNAASAGCCGDSGNASSANASGAVATVENGVQTVATTLSDGYVPITVYAGIPVKWTISAPSGSITSCNRTVEIPEFNVEHTFTQGDNVIEFTPTKAGTYTYTCWMGMIRSTITVVEQ